MFSDNADVTKLVRFDVGGSTTGTTMKLLTTQSANRTLTLPSTTDTIVCKSTTDIMTNKTLLDSTCSIADNSDNTKKLVFSVGLNTTAITTTIQTDQTTSKTYTIPDMASSNFVMSEGGQTLNGDMEFTGTIDPQGSILATTASGAFTFDSASDVAVRTIIWNVSGLADTVATTHLVVSVPNLSCSLSFSGIFLATVAPGAAVCAASGQLHGYGIISRIAGVVAKANVTTASIIYSDAAILSISAFTEAVTGGATATNTVTFQITVNLAGVAGGLTSNVLVEADFLCQYSSSATDITVTPST